jgi:RNA polymerase sigma-70 factor (sigma-E family)
MRGDEAFTAFWQREHDRLHRALTLTLSDRDLASDAVDEAFARSYARWSRVQGLDDPAGWVYRVALNWATSWLRKRRLRPTRPIEALDRAVDDPIGDDGLASAVARLPITQRSVVVLRFYLDWPVDRIAGSLGVPPGTVKSRLHRALGALREQVEVRG